MFHGPDGSGEQANGTARTPVGQGLHEEKDPDDRPICDFFAANDAAFGVCALIEIIVKDNVYKNDKSNLPTVRVIKVKIEA